MKQRKRDGNRKAEVISLTQVSASALPPQRRGGHTSPRFDAAYAPQRYSPPRPAARAHFNNFPGNEKTRWTHNK